MSEFKSFAEFCGSYGSRKLHPNMKDFVFFKKSSNNYYLVDLIDAEQRILSLFQELKEMLQNNKKVLFVIGKLNSSDIVLKFMKDNNLLYMTKWIGGFLTNFKIVKSSCIDELNKIYDLEDRMDEFKSEKYEILARKKKLSRYFDGVKNLNCIPDAIFVLDLYSTSAAAKEARKAGIKVLSLIDSNCDPKLVDKWMPLNCFSSKCMTMFLDFVGKAIENVDLNWSFDKPKKKILVFNKGEKDNE